jgi:hypothetical protein
MMIRATRSVPRLFSRLFLASLALVGMVGCKNYETEQTKLIAGTYAMTSHDRFAARLLKGSTMTLNADGTWRRTILPMDPTFGMAVNAETGTWIYRPEGPTLGLRSSEGRPTNLLVRGDTLFGVHDERAVALAEAVTNVKMTGGPDAFYVRIR